MQTGGGDRYDSDGGPGPTRLGPFSLEEDPWRWWRRQMPVATRWAYFDHAAVAPLSAPAAEAIRSFADQAANLGDTVWPKWAARVEDLRRSVAELLTVDADEICMVPNTSTGINFVAEGWPWKPGDSVVVPEGEFPSNLFPWLNQRDRGVEVRIVPRRNGQVLVDDLMAHVDDSTKLISASWVGYSSGFRLDVASLVDRAHRRGVLVFLDAIQGLGVHSLNLQQIPVDFLAADGHKWLLGPEGAGIAVIRRSRLPQLRCGNVGWSSVKNSHDFQQARFELRDDAARFEAGSANMVGIAALAASLEIFLAIRRQHGAAAIENRVLELTGQLDQLLREAGAITCWPHNRDERSGILTFEVPGVEPAAVRRACLERNVVVSCRGHGIRASVHAYNDREDLERLAAIVRDLLPATT